MSPRVWLFLGAILAGSGVAVGAYGAHGLERRLQNELADQGGVEQHPALSLTRLLADYEVAVRYQIVHALALVLVGILANLAPSRWWTAAGVLLVAGVLVFCGGLYALVFTRDVAWGARIPFGGLALMLGWLCVAAGSLGAHFRPATTPSGSAKGPG